MVKLNNSLKALISCYLIALQVYTGWCQTLSESVVQVRQDTRYLCAGTLIRNDLAITAAHCLRNGATVTGVSVLYGGINGNASDVTRIGIHPNYDAATRANDVASLTLGTPAPNNIPVASLCTQNWPADNVGIFVYAWNLPSDPATTIAPALNFYNFNTYSRSNCQALYPTKVNVGHSSHACGFDPAEGNCFRDRGGPVEFNGQFCGIMSFSFVCTSQQLPGVFINTGMDGVNAFIRQEWAVL